MKRVLAPGYDLFKLVVTLILAAILFILLLRGCSSTPSRPAPTTTTESTAAALEPITSTPILPASVPPTATDSPTPAPTPTETPTPTVEAPTPAEEPAPTAAPTPEQTRPPIATPPANPDCPGAAISRITVGTKVRVLTHLNMRIEPGLSGAWILTNITGTELEVIGGPACTALDQRAYEWWRVRRSDGKEGWSAEASLNRTYYFLEPIP